MATPDDSSTPRRPSHMPSPPPRSELLSSKFLRKTKFRRKSMTNSQAHDSESAGAGEPNSDSAVPFSPQPPPDRMDERDDFSPIVIPPIAALLEAPNIKIESPKYSSLEIPGSRSPKITPTKIEPPPSPRPSNSTMPPQSDTGTGTTTSRQLDALIEVSHTPLTEGQIYHAKCLVLDLLGWGVDPEYLVTCGVHPDLIRRIFNDLNLRLPTNLALTGKEE
ncbi:hypothetical protein B0H34DRAFT_800224 [Crassisporium funariophilum]|nr:hypothetical protein B0H34DRAFT_800224 [Crassisporium funariophilum]